MPNQSQSKTLTLDRVCVGNLTYPKSLYENIGSIYPVIREADAVTKLKEKWYQIKRSSTSRPIAHHSLASEYKIFNLDDFTVYRQGFEKSRWEMITLDQLMNRPGLESFLLDGRLSCGEESFNVKRVPFSVLTIEGYGDSSTHSVGDNICIQSEIGYLKSVWYRLRKASSEYERYFMPFVWLANFCKFYVDYLIETPTVFLENFRVKFADWLIDNHGKSKAFRIWHHQHNKADFRCVVVANIGFLWKETGAVSQLATMHPIWEETDCRPLKRVIVRPVEELRTMVTPFVYKCFSGTYFAECLKIHKRRLQTTNDHRLSIQSSEEMGCRVSLPGQILIKPQLSSVDRTEFDFVTPLKKYKSGQAIKIKKTLFSSKDALQPRFAYITNTFMHEDCQLLEVIWLYEPHQTILSNMTYVHKNELFLSVDCNCKTSTAEKLQSGDIMGQIKLTWSTGSSAHVGRNTYVIRQKYNLVDNSFRTITKDDFGCSCDVMEKSAFQTAKKKYTVFDAVIYESRVLPISRYFIGIIISYNEEKQKILIRKMQVDSDGSTGSPSAGNKLRTTNNYLLINPQRLQRKCHIKIIPDNSLRSGLLPVPYRFGGLGDYYLLVDEENFPKQKVNVNSTAYGHFDTLFTSKTRAKFRKLKGLGLFCGGGHFDRSLQIAGGIEIVCAVDISKSGILTYHANLTDKKSTELFLGSVDDFFKEILAGDSENLPEIGDIDIIVAGSPCQGFSAAQPDRLSERSLKNSSLVASVAAFIDLYRPKYALLENVITMAQSTGISGEQNILSQLLCVIVGIGYQTQVFNMDAWSFGCPQRRSRLFLIVTAPGFTVPVQPQPTHIRPQCIHNCRTGKASNGQVFGTRAGDAALFDSVSAGQATRDLPNIGDSHVQMCIKFPDHRLAREESEVTRTAISMIPTCPSQLGIVQAINMGVMGQRQIEYWSEQSVQMQAVKSKAYKRIKSSNLFPTIMTRVNPTDAFAGQVVHWTQHRVISLMEARRAQGIPDDEVIIGSLCEQWKIIGNTVPGPVGIALGISIAEAWFAYQEAQTGLEGF